ncbi:MAG TPA: hypothetical protein VEA38_04095 [Terriglobales bacterium]|nr:hypothetical protein [Terriglobales bacterium]
MSESAPSPAAPPEEPSLHARVARLLIENRLADRAPRSFYELAALARINRAQFSKQPYGVALKLMELVAAGKNDEAVTEARKIGRKRRRATGSPRRRAS